MESKYEITITRELSLYYIPLIPMSTCYTVTPGNRIRRKIAINALFLLVKM